MSGASQNQSEPPFPESLVKLAWHAVVFDDEGRPQCTACLSPGDDACPVMQIVLNTECPFPDEDGRCHKCGSEISLINDGDDGLGPVVCVKCFGTDPPNMP